MNRFLASVATSCGDQERRRQGARNGVRLTALLSILAICGHGREAFAVPSGTPAPINLAAFLSAPGAIGGETPGPATFSSLKVNSISGSAQCLHADTTGAITGAGFDCVNSSGVSTQAANSLLANFTSSSATPVANAVPSCSALGAYLKYTSGSALSCGAPAVPLASKPAGPAATTSTTLVMAGLGVSYTPAATGRVLITVSGDLAVNSIQEQVNAALYYGTGTAPANGAAVTGTPLGNAISARPSSGLGSASPFSVTYIVTGLTVGTPIWIDLGFDTASASGSAQLLNISVVAVEL